MLKTISEYPLKNIHTQEELQVLIQYLIEKVTMHKIDHQTSFLVKEYTQLLMVHIIKLDLDPTVLENFIQVLEEYELLPEMFKSRIEMFQLQERDQQYMTF